MKKSQVLALVTALALGGGSVFAATANHNKVEKTQTAVAQDIQIQLDTQDEELLKAFEDGEVEIIVEADDQGTVKVTTQDGILIETTDADLAKAIEAGEVSISIEE